MSIFPLSRIWTETFAWLPVIPIDERGVFWLEPLWRRRRSGGWRWEYRSFREDGEKSIEDAQLACWPPLKH